jgi:hypothetical protein
LCSDQRLAGANDNTAQKASRILEDNFRAAVYLGATLIRGGEAVSDTIIRETPATIAPKFSFDTSNIEWKEFVTEGCYYRILDVNVPARTADMIVKFEPNARCLNHRHVARTMSFVLEGELHVLEKTRSK